MTDPERIEHYLAETLHAPVRLSNWDGETGLAAYLRRYRYQRTTIGGIPVLLIFATEEITPRVAHKHLTALREYWDDSTAFVLDAITPRGRQRLVSQGIPFVVADSQVYLPMLGVNLTERYQLRRQTTDRLRPSAQLLLLYLLNAPTQAEETAGVTAQRLGYTAAALGQSLNQLEEAGLVSSRKVGRERPFELAGPKREIWTAAQGLLTSPVRERRRYARLPAAPAMLLAGFSALAHYSMLSEPEHRVLACSHTQARALPPDDGLSPDEAAVEIEVWAYAPEVLSTAPIVDRLSLYLSLREQPDERVQAALGEMMGEIGW